MGITEEKNGEIKEAAADKISVLLEDLSSLESYANDLFSFLPLPVCLVSSVGIILDVNPSFEEISGYKIEEIVGNSAEKVFKKKEIEELSKEILEKGTVKTREISIFAKDKKEIFGSASATLRKTEEEESVGYFLSFFDLTEIKEREKDLQNTQSALTNMIEDVEEARITAEEEKNKTAAVINNLTDGLLVFDRDNNLFSINPFAESFFDIKARDLIGRPISELKTFPTLEPLMNVLGERIKNVFREEISVKKDLILEISTIPIMRKEKKSGVLVILHDITREKMVERIKTEFVSLAAHQLRTPLAAIKWTLKMFLDGDLGDISSEQREFIEKTYISNERMISLINDLLDVTRIEEGRYLYKPSLNNFENIVNFVMQSHKDNIEKKKIKFEFKKLKTKIPKIKIDVEKIRVAVDNLIDNAIKYTPDGGNITAFLDYSEKEKEIEFKVQDSGVGIPLDQQNRIFSKFFRGANVMRMDTEGSGLGIFITKNIIEAHGGKIGFESKEGEGSTFYFTLPIKKEFEEFIEKF